MDERLAEHVRALRGGGVIACATETLFGLLADARSEAAVQRVIELKHRGPEPIALLVPDLAWAETIAELDERARALAAQHWPGPLTLVLRARSDSSLAHPRARFDRPPGEALPAALLREGTIGVRVPGPSPALDLVRAFAGPLTATSCNPSGLPAARTADEARAYFGDRLAAILPLSAPGGPPSTLVDLTGDRLRVLREGAVRI